MSLRNLDNPEWHKYLALAMQRQGVTELRFNADDIISAFETLQGKTIVLREDHITRELIVTLEALPK